MPTFGQKYEDSSCSHSLNGPTRKAEGDEYDFEIGYCDICKSDNAAIKLDKSGNRIGFGIVRFVSQPQTVELEKYFQESSGLSFVHGELRMESHRVRFYFGEGSSSSPPKSWKHILEVATDEIEKRDADQVIKLLDSAKWLDRLKASPGKVLVFENGKLFIHGDCP